MQHGHMKGKDFVGLETYQSQSGNDTMFLRNLRTKVGKQEQIERSIKRRLFNGPFDQEDIHTGCSDLFKM